MSLLNLLKVTDNSIYSREDIKNLILLLTADRILNPDEISAEPSNKLLQFADVINRNEELILTFPEFFKDLQTENALNPKLISEVDAYLIGRKSELLYIPGSVHEIMLSKGITSERKKQGSYYTPINIITYMTDISVKYLSDREAGIHRQSPKVLDPACGGAFFLIEFFYKLTESGVPVQTAIESICGTDIDDHAVLTAIFALTLAVSAKYRTFGSLKEIKHLWQFQIKKGNALCKNSSDLNDGIDWQTCFPAVFGPQCPEPGFDIVIGNPPYVSNKLISTNQKKYYKDNYSTAVGQFDLSVLFMEQGIKLLKNGGVLTYITSNKFMAADYGLKLRQYLVNSCEVCEIVDVSTLKSFKNTSVYPVILSVKNNSPTRQSVTRVYNISSWEELAKAQPVLAGRKVFTGNNRFIMTTRLNNEILPIIRRIEETEQRIPENKIHCGIAISGFGQWVKKENQITANQMKNYYPLIQAGHITTYSISSDDFIDVTCCNCQKWLSVKGPKLVIPGIARKLTAAVDFEDKLLGRVYFIRQGDTDYDLYYLAALFNSYLLNFYYSILYWPIHLEGGYLRFNSTYLANLPIVTLSLLTPEKNILINSLMEIGTELVSGNLPKNLLYEKQCLANALTFALYSFSVTEAKTVMDFLEIPQETVEKIISILKAQN